MHVLNDILEKLARFQLALSAVAVALLLITIAAQIFMRSVLNSSLGPTLEIVIYFYMIPIAFLPVMQLELGGGHVATDLFFQRFTIRVQEFSIVIAGLLAAIVYGALFWYTLEQAIKSTAKGEVSMGAYLLPIWQVRWVLPVVFASSTVAAVAQAVMQIRIIENIQRG